MRNFWMVSVLVVTCAQSVFGEEKWAEVHSSKAANKVWTFDWSPDNSLLAMSDHGGSTRVMKVASGEVVMKENHGPKLSKLAMFSPDGKMLVTGGYNRALKMYSVDNGFTKKWEVKLPHRIIGASFSGDSEWVIVKLDQDYSLKSKEGLEEIYLFYAPYEGPMIIFRRGGKRSYWTSFSQDSTEVSAYFEGGFYTWDLKGSRKASEENAKREVYTERASRDKSVKDRTKLPNEIKVLLDARQRFDVDGTSTVLTDRGSVVVRAKDKLSFGKVTDTRLRELPTAAGEDIWAVTLNPSDTLLAVATAAGSVIAFDTKTGAKILEKKMAAGVRALSFSKNGGLLAIGDEAGNVKILQVSF